MKILEEIEVANYWRETELMSLPRILIRIKNKNEKIALLNASIPLIYAHWEGFVSSSLKILMEFLNAKKLNCIDIHTNVLTNGYEINLKEDLSNPTYEKESFKKIKIISRNVKGKRKARMDVYGSFAGFAARLEANGSARWREICFI